MHGSVCHIPPLQGPLIPFKSVLNQIGLCRHFNPHLWIKHTLHLLHAFLSEIYLAPQFLHNLDDNLLLNRVCVLIVARFRQATVQSAQRIAICWPRTIFVLPWIPHILSYSNRVDTLSKHLVPCLRWSHLHRRSLHLHGQNS